MDELNLGQKVAIWALPVLLAITLHEVAHGYVARQCGDDTAARLHRLSLNPLRHIDPVGTVLIPVILLVTSGMLFGWAKPVPVSYQRLRHPKRDMALVAVAGPAANLVMAVLWALSLKLALAAGAGWVTTPLAYMALAGMSINGVLMVLNLLPIPPLDGGRVLAGVLPRSLEPLYQRIEPYGLFIVFGLMATGLLSTLLRGPVVLFQRWLLGLAGVSGL